MIPDGIEITQQTGRPGTLFVNPTDKSYFIFIGGVDGTYWYALPANAEQLVAEPIEHLEILPQADFWDEDNNEPDTDRLELKCELIADDMG